MSGVAPDLIAGYLEELYAGLRVPAAEAELIAAEAEDHLRETTAAGLAIGMTEREAQEAAISSFEPVRAVVRAHRRRAVTAAAAAMAAWKLAALLATTVGAGGLAGMGIFAYLLRSAPDDRDQGRQDEQRDYTARGHRRAGRDHAARTRVRDAGPGGPGSAPARDDQAPRHAEPGRIAGGARPHRRLAGPGRRSGRGVAAAHNTGGRPRSVIELEH